MADLVDQTIAHFRIEAKLGEGGMGVVYRATDETLRRHVALKVLPESVASSPERRLRFLREARAAAAVTHNNIATVHEVGEADGHVFIAMELIPGETLRDKMAPGLTHVEAVRIAREIARGLARAHENGVVHRDLKPENVMVTPDGDVKILDFGLAKLREPEPTATSVATGPTVAQLTAGGSLMGTPAYMSPEQVEGREEVDARSDVFSFGVMFYEMLTGIRPFRGTSTVEVLYRVLHLEVPPVESLSPDVAPDIAAVVGRCLKKAREDRFASGRELLTALRGESGPYLSEAPSARALPAEKISTITGMGTALGATVASETGRAPLPPPAPRAEPRRGRTVGAILALVVLIGSVGAIWTQHRRAHAVTTAPSASASSSPRHPVAITEHPTPKTASPDAAVRYASALSRLRIGALESQRELKRATLLDPSLAAAQLRLTLYAPYYGSPAAERRRSFTKATLFASTLEPRDVALLRVAEAIALDPPDLDEALKRARALAESDPGDAEVALLIYTLLYWTGREDERVAASRHVLELDPKGTQVLDGEAFLAMDQGDVAKARALVDRCIEMVPAATYCRQLRALLAADAGQCDVEMGEARELVKLDPDAAGPYAVLAQALLATGAPIESVRGALAQAEARTPDEILTPKALTALELALVVGDFVSAEALLRTIGDAVERSSSEKDHALVASIRITVAEETGDRAGALRIADSFEHEAVAWTADAPLAVRAQRLYLMHQMGKLGTAALNEQRDGLVDAWMKRQTSPTAAGRASEILRVAARYGQTALETRSVLGPDAAPAFSATRDARDEVAFGRFYLLAGRPNEAIPWLEQLTHSCRAIDGEVVLDGDVSVPLDFIVAHALLGEALEAKGDKAGACKAYRVVEARWKDARPRSVTMEKAKARIAALACAK